MIVPHHGDWLWKADPYNAMRKQDRKQHLKYTIFLEFQWSDEKWMKQKNRPLSTTVKHLRS